jgi:hypothetical protein
MLYGGKRLSQLDIEFIHHKAFLNIWIDLLNQKRKYIFNELE